MQESRFLTFASSTLMCEIDYLFRLSRRRLEKGIHSNALVTFFYYP